MFRHATLVRAGLALLAAAPALLACCLRMPGPWGLCFEGDEAVAELYVRHALEGSQLLGPYSRFHWNHPGPMLFYLLAPLYGLLQEPIALRIGGSLLNAAALCGAVLVAWRFRGPAGGWVVALVSATAIGALDTYRLETIWGPHVVVFPLFFELVVAMAVASGDAALLPWLALAASFLAQTHASVVLPAVGTGITATLFCLLRGPRTRRALVPSLTALALLVLLWAPVLVEAVTMDGGNLAHLARFFMQPPDHLQVQPAGVALLGVAERLVDIPVRLASSTSATLAVALAIVLTGAVVGVLARAARRGDAQAPPTLAITGVALVATLAASTRVVGELHAYLFDWIGAISAFLWCVLVLFLVPKEGAIAPTGWAVLGVLTTANLARVGMEVGAHVGDAAPSPTCTGAERVVRHLDARKVERPRVVIVTHARWPVAAGLLLSLHKRGVEFSVGDPWPFMFGEQHRDRGEADHELLLGSPTDLQAEPPENRIAILRGQGGPLAVFHGP